jgi:2-oxoglutarate dehydrogenase E2 component (dihydrolipoamide succinyltransferase)
MPTDVVMPQMGESIFEGTITRWLKQPGDVVRADEPLFEISTDKVDVEIPSPVTGTLTEILVVEGVTATVNTVVARIADAGAADSTASSAAAKPAAPPAPVAQPSAPSSAEPAAKPAPESDVKAVPTPSAAPSRPATGTPAKTSASSSPSAPERLRSSPLVRRIASEHNVDLRRVPGTGSAGRITRDDLLRFLATASTNEASGEAPDEVSAEPALVEQRIPMTRMRAMIADRMMESRRTSAHAHTVFRIDMTRIVRLREREKAAFEARHGVRLTYMPFIAAATIAALRRFPVLNAAIDGDAIQYHGNVNLGIAVALDWGLIVPVVHRADQLAFAELARAIADVAERSRTKKLKPEEVGGGTFTLTNSGLFGEEFGMPILNQPESAILAIGGLKKAPVVLPDVEGNDTIAIRSVQHFCLGIDHRIIDGADAGRFMTEFKRQLESWSAPVL